MRFKHQILSALLLSLASLSYSSWSHPAVAQENKPTVVYNIKGNLPDLKFELQGLNKTISSEDLKGKVVAVFFGYASCPDICPTTMTELAILRESFSPEEAAQFQIVFISVDPHRDTAEILQAYVDAFENDAIGVTGTAAQIADIAKRYRVAYEN